MSPKISKNTFENAEEIATVRIELLDTDPLIWREVEVPASITLKGLHDTVQAAMGWLDYHLWEFTIDGQAYGLPKDKDYGEAPRRVAAKVRLREVLKLDETVIGYLYDFGDDWAHRIVVTNIRPGDAKYAYPRYVSGERNGPPEDCGGIPGFYEMLAVMANPEHPDHDEVREWADGYNPDLIDERSIAYALARIASRRNAAR